MNPAYGIVAWIIIGALAGWLGSKIMGTDARQGGLANIVIGVIGAVVGGFISRYFFGNDASTNSLLGSFLIALMGSCVVIFSFKILSPSASNSK